MIRTTHGSMSAHTGGRSTPTVPATPCLTYADDRWPHHGLCCDHCNAEEPWSTRSVVGHIMSRACGEEDRVNRVWQLPLIGLVFLLTACQPPQAVTPPPPPPKVTVSQVVARHVVESDAYTGRLEAVESVDIRARVNGYLQSIQFTDGEVVKKGALLFVIDPRPYQAELDRAKAAFEQAMARYERTQKDVARAQQLVKSRAMSQEEVDTRAADQRQAQEAVQAARAAV